MNKQGPGKIDWCDYTWNPISGCEHGCPYCYMLRMEKRFPGIMKPQFKPHLLKEPIRKKKPSKIFVGSSGDMWGEWVPSAWIQIVLDTCRESPHHTFQFLTKNPERYGDFILPLNGWYGTTCDGTQRTEDNIYILDDFVPTTSIKFVSFEPLLDGHHFDIIGMDWIIIGADSNRGAKKPPNLWADRLVTTARQEGIAVWVKDNYKYHTVIKEFPE